MPRRPAKRWSATSAAVPATSGSWPRGGTPAGGCARGRTTPRPRPRPWPCRPPGMPMAADGPLLGRSIPNVDGVALVTGQARYTGDLRPHRMAHGRIVRSPYAHALILSVDASAALAMDGVLDVIVPDDVAGLPLVSTGPLADMPLLARGKVRYAGEPVAAVIAESEEIAEQALELVQVDYQDLPVLLDPEAALLPDAPLLHEGLDGVEGNACWRQVTSAGDIEAAFRSADLVLRERFRTSKAHAMPMETHAAVAEWDPLDGPTLWTSTQQPHVVRNVIAHVFGLPQSKVRVCKPFVGGAFGHKEGLHTHESMALLGARRLGRPVRFVLTRTEEFSATVSRNPQIRDVEIALRGDGTVLGWRERIVQDVGAYSGLGPSVLALSEWVTVGPYRTPALDIEGVCVYTTKPPASAFRGFGNPQATFAREVMFDIAARALGIDPFELRRRNVIRQRDLPTRTANGLKLDTLPIEEAMAVAAAEIGLEALRARLRPFQGIGVANMIEWGGGCRWLDDWDADVGSVTVTLHLDGSAVVASDAADSGQGHTTLFTQIAADVLGVEPARISMVRGDTERSPYGLGTFGNRTSIIQASALHRACAELRERLLEVAANALEADAEDLAVEAGRIVVRGTRRGIDVGRTLHPDLLKGQVQGGIAQGIGYALGEDLLFDPSGTMLNPSMVDYQVPTAPEVPLIEDKLRTLHSDDPAHPLRNKGIGESGVTPAAAAIANAVHDAIGVPITSLPLTPEKVLDAIDRSRAQAR